MSLIKRSLFYLSLGVMFMAHTVRHVFLRITGTREHVHGVRVLLVRAGRVVLVRHWHAPYVWTLPGGHVARGEKLQDAGAREVFEETGYSVHSFAGTVGTYQGRLGKHDNVTVFYTEDFEGGLKFLPGFEIMERGLFDLDDLPKNTSPANRRRIESFIAGVRDESGKW